MTMNLTGALAGWKRVPSAHGIVLSLQVVDTADQFARAHFTRVDIALNDRQLRSLARDLMRAAHERGVELHAAKRWWRVWRD